MPETLGGTSLLTRFTWSMSVVLGLLGLLVIALSQWQLPEHHWVREFSTEIGIAAASGGIVGFVYEHLIRRDLLDQVRAQLRAIVDADAQRFGVAAIFDSRTDKASRVVLRELLGTAERELLLFGIGLAPIVTEHADELERAAQRGCQIKLLLFDVASGAATLLEDSLGKGDLIDNLRGSFGSAVALEQKAQRPGSIEVRLYDVVPTFGAVAIDRENSDGRLFVELNCFRSSGDQCPGLELRKVPGGIFHNYNRQITTLWDSARRVSEPLPEAPKAQAPGQ